MDGIQNTNSCFGHSSMALDSQRALAPFCSQASKPELAAVMLANRPAPQTVSKPFHCSLTVSITSKRARRLYSDEDSGKTGRERIEPATDRPRQAGQAGRSAALCRPRRWRLRLVAPAHERYDAGMTRSKIAISLPKEQVAKVHREVRAGRADSVSGYIARVLAEHEKRESLQVLLRDLIEKYGEPGAEDIKWAERALAPRRRG